jgi:hypothetical protein
VKVVYKNLKLLFAGNGKAVNTGFTDADILRTGDKIQEIVLKESSPQILVSTGKIEANGIRVISTNQSGALIIESTGDNIEIVEY